MIGWGFLDVLFYFCKLEGYEGGVNDFYGGDGLLCVMESLFEDFIYDMFV